MNPFVFTGIANGVIGQYRAVMIDSAVADGVKLPTSATVQVAGVTLEPSTAAGQSVGIQQDGIAEIIATSAVVRGDSVKVDTAGGIVATVTAADKCIGTVLLGAGAGERAKVLLRQHTL